MGSTRYEERALINRQKRQNQLRYNILVLILSVVMVISISILFISFSTQANDMEHQHYYKYYKSIEIAQGDTLWSIAKSNMDCKHYNSTYEYIAEVRKMNSLTSDKIIAGNHIIVPYYSTEFISN